MADKKSEPAGGADKKKGGSKLVIINVAVLALLGVGVGGFLFLSKPAAPAEGGGHEAAGAVASNAPLLETDTFPTLVVDLRDREGATHHLKLGIAVELTKPKQKEELEKLKPRAREAVITYLRTLDFEKATDPAQYTQIREELSKLVMEAIENQGSRVLIVDYVCQ